MPYEKVVVTHKFGIISQSHKAKLQERILQRRQQLQEEASRSKRSDDNISLQITEEFVNEYNKLSPERKAKHNGFCLQILEKIKKKLLASKSIDDINMQLAWAELSQLMQCNSPFQEDCMDLLTVSLEHAKLSITQIPTIFFLAETVIYWLRTDTINQPYLRSSEIKLLKIGKLVFQRIYFHMLDGSLDSQSELKDHLAVYLQGLEESEEVYSPYPDALLYIKCVTAIGRLISETAEGFIQGVKSVTFKTEVGRDDSLLMNESQLQAESARTRADESSPRLQQPNVSKVESLNHFESVSKGGGAGSFAQRSSESGRVIPIAFWHAIDLFTCLVAKSKLPAKSEMPALEKALGIMLESAATLKKENWLMAANCLYVLGECAKLSPKALNVLLHVGLGKLKLNGTASDELVERSLFSYQDEDLATARSGYHRNHFGLESWPWELCCVYVDVLVDVCLKSAQTQIKRKALMGFNKDAAEAMRKKVSLSAKPAWCGLLDLTKFQLIVASPAVEDYSWKVRYFALKGLIHICKYFNNDTENEDFRRTCWTSLVVCYESEADPRVLEAFKVGQINFAQSPEEAMKSQFIRIRTPMDENIYAQLARRFSEISTSQKETLKSSESSKKAQESVGAKLRPAPRPLLKLDLPRVHPEPSDDDELYSIRIENTPAFGDEPDRAGPGESPASARKPAAGKKAPQTGAGQAKRTTLQEEILFHNQFQNKIPDYFTRKGFDLMRIVEDQYRKEEKEKFEREIFRPSN